MNKKSNTKLVKSKKLRHLSQKNILNLNLKYFSNYYKTNNALQKYWINRNYVKKHPKTAVFVKRGNENYSN